MSETVCYSGVIKKIPRGEHATLEDHLKEILAQEGIALEEGYDSVEYQFRDDLDDKYFIYKDEMYEMDRKTKQYEDVFESVALPDGRIFFVVTYYTGCCSFGEAMDQALEKSVQ